MSFLRERKKLTILATVLVLLFSMSMVSANNNDAPISHVIFEIDGEYYKVSMDDWAQAYFYGEGDEDYDFLIQGIIIGLVSDGRYIDFASYAEEYFHAEGDMNTALANSDDLDQGIVDQVQPYPPDDDDDELVWQEVSNRTQFNGALNKLRDGDINAIRLVGNITLDDQFIVERAWDLRVLDLNGYTINFDGGMLAIRSDNTTVENGRISGDVTWWDWDDVDFAENVWADNPWENWNGSSSEVLMVSGDSITFDNVNFDVDFADWFQEQGNRTATNLTIKNSALYGVSLFHGIDVTIMDTDVYNRIGIENQDVENDIVPSLIRVDFKENPGPLGVAGSLGICYINNSNATMEDIGWLDDFTGLYVGKSLKYYGEYDEAKPTLDNAIIETNKDGLVWWALNHYKAELIVNGEVDIWSSPENEGPGLMMVGTDSSDYPALAENFADTLGDSGLQEYFEDVENRITERIVGSERGGKILGNATFTSRTGTDRNQADIWIGKPTQDFLDAYDESYRGDTYKKYDLCEKSPVSLKGVDYQVSWKDADRLYIGGGLNFDTWVNVFTPSNDYIGCIDKLDNCESEYGYKDEEETIEHRAPFADSVWLGDVTFDGVNMWGDFMIEDSKTVDFQRMYVRCGNIRSIYTRADLRDCTCEVVPEFEERGTLVGGDIYSDTKYENVLVFGDGLRVEGATLTNQLYNVILETTWLEDVDINVGNNPTSDEEREVCGYDLNNYPDGNLYDVFVWCGHHATLSNSGWSTNTDIEVRSTAKLSFAGDIDNQGTVKFQELAHIGFIDPVDFTKVDPRDGHSTTVKESGGFVEIETKRGSTPGWNFNGWKNDIRISADDGIISAKYLFEVYYDGNKEVYLIDLRHQDNYDWADIDGFENVWLTDILDVEKDHFGDNDIRVVISRDKDSDEKTFDLTADGWFRNCCCVPQIDLGSATRTVTPGGKDIQVAPFDIEIIEADWDVVGECGEDAEGTLTVDFEVTNTGTVAGSDTISLAFGGTNVGDIVTSKSVFLTPGQTYSGSFEYDTGTDFALDEEVAVAVFTEQGNEFDSTTVNFPGYVYFVPYELYTEEEMVIGESHDIRYDVTNYGNIEGTQDVYRIAVRPDGTTLVEDTWTTTIAPGDTVTVYTYTGYTPGQTGTYTRTISTDDCTKVFTTEVVDQ